jgi:transposase-like protein
MAKLSLAMAQPSYRRHRFPAEIIQHAIWLYLRFTLSYRDVEELLAGRGLGHHRRHPCSLAWLGDRQLLAVPR